MIHSTRTNLRVAVTNRWEIFVAVALLGSSIVLITAWLAVAVISPPKGYTYDEWFFLQRRPLGTFLVALASLWTFLGSRSFLTRRFREEAFRRCLASCAGVGAVSGCLFVILSTRGMATSLSGSLAFFAVLSGFILLRSARRASEWDDAEPSATTKLIWSAAGRFIVPALSIGGTAWIIVTINHASPLRNDTTTLTTAAALWIAWSLFFVVGTSTLNPSFTPSALHVGSMLFSELVTLPIGAVSSWIVVQFVCSDLLPSIHVYSANIFNTFAGMMFFRQLTLRAWSLGMTLDGFLVWVVSAVAFFVGQGVLSWILAHIGLQVSGTAGSVVLRRGRRVLGA